VTESAPTSEATPDLVSRVFDATSLAGLRHELSSRGEESGLTDLTLARFVLAVNEITTNAVRHGGGRGRLRMWRQGDHLWCEIVDEGRGIPRGRLNASHRPVPGHIGGWGLWLAQQICSTLRVDTGSAGTRVRLSYPIPGI
jgi:anti-sigma regulatory factor (Ser/Thr protein kinase)